MRRKNVQFGRRKGSVSVQELYRIIAEPLEFNVKALEARLYRLGCAHCDSWLTAQAMSGFALEDTYYAFPWLVMNDSDVRRIRSDGMRTSYECW